MSVSRLDKSSLPKKTVKISNPNIKSTEPLSRLATQLAHDLNVPLASILAYAEELVDLAKERYGIEGFNQLVEYIEIIQKEAYHCKEIVGKMLTYAKGLEIHLETVNVHELLQECVEDFKPSLKDKVINIKTEFQPKLPNITTDPTGLRQVIMNVLSNAADAIQEKGEIVLRTGLQDKAVLIEISDNGAGIDEAHLGKIFNPFFTTKGSGKGTGLGLAICDGIVQTLKGKISVKSKKGKGTTISILMPRKIKVILT
jgi:two-component system NtrC family sensor kinase